MNWYIREEIEKKQRELRTAKGEKSAWEKVEVVTKKDGTQFKNFTQNFKNCSFSVRDWNLSPYEKTMYVSFQANGYESDYLDCFRTLEKGEEVKHPENIYHRGSGWKDGYMYSVDEMMEVVANRIAYLDSYIAKVEKAIEEEKSMSEYVDRIQDELETIKEENNEKYYMIIHALHKMW